MSNEKRHFSMRISSELFDKIQKYAERMQTTATAVVEESVRLALPKALDRVSCRVYSLEEGQKTRVRCEIYVPSWSRNERWEAVVGKREVPGKKDDLIEKAQKWAFDHLGLEALEVTSED